MDYKRNRLNKRKQANNGLIFCPFPTSRVGESKRDLWQNRKNKSLQSSPNLTAWLDQPKGKSSALSYGSSEKVPVCSEEGRSQCVEDRHQPTSRV